MKKTTFATALVAGALALGLAGNAWAAGSPILQDAITVDGQTYDTIIGPDVPNNGPFQVLNADHTTEFAPGDAGYLPRWDAGDGKYFICPLLGQPPTDL